jgi:hypothetical protein
MDQGLSQWLDIRDEIVRQCSGKKVLEAIKRLESCPHPEAQWLWNVLRKAESDEEIERCLKHELEQNGRGNGAVLFFLSELSPFNFHAPDWLLEAANAGYGAALADMARRSSSQMVEFARLAVEKNERRGYYWLGQAYAIGAPGCEKNLDEARRCYRIAVNLGCQWSEEALGGLLDVSDPEKWQLLGKAALGGDMTFVTEFGSVVGNFMETGQNHESVFAIGRSLNNQIFDGRLFLPIWRVSSKQLQLAEKAVAFFKAECVAAKKAVFAWSLVGVRLGVVKDIRVLIGKLIWDARSEAKYEVDF